MKNILQVHGGMERAGTEAVIMSWYRNIDRERVKFDFTTTFERKCSYDKEIKELGGNILYIPPRSKVGTINHFKELFKLMKYGTKYDVVHSHMNFHGGLVSFAAKLAGIKKVVCHAHNTQEDIGGIKRKIEIFILRRLIIMFSDDLIACSDEAGKFIFGNKSKYKVINNAIDTNKFKPSNMDLENKLKKMKCEYKIDSSLIIGHIGRFSKQKNHKFIMSVLSNMKKRKIDFKMIFIGDGELKDDIISESIRLNIQENILFLGIQENIDEWLNIMDIFIFPSLYEGLGVVLIEAQGVGLPCIVSNNVPKEVDLGLDLLDFVGINENEKEWVDIILEKSNNKILDVKRIKDKIIKSGYDLENNMENIYKLYGENID